MESVSAAAAERIEDWNKHGKKHNEDKAIAMALEGTDKQIE